MLFPMESISADIAQVIPSCLLPCPKLFPDGLKSGSYMRNRMYEKGGLVYVFGWSSSISASLQAREYYGNVTIKDMNMVIPEVADS